MLCPEHISQMFFCMQPSDLNTFRNSLYHCSISICTNFSTLSIGVSVRLTNYFAPGQLLKVVHGGKEFSNVLSNQDFPRLDIIARWGHLPISMVLRSERSLKSKMLSLARTSKYMNDTSELSIKSQRRTERTRQTG